MVELNKWNNDLIGCPSQCYYYFVEDNKLKCIYLRWRWDDPWSVDLITFRENKFPCDYWDICSEDAEWEEVDLGYFREHELEKLQEKAVRKLVKRNTFFRLWERRK